MIPKPIAQIELADLTALIGNARESKTLEFKRELSAKDGDLALLKGVSALGNTSGGDFVIGIETTKDGIASAVAGVAVPNLDQEKLRLEQLLSTCIEPRLPRVDINPVPCGNGRYTFVIRVAYSWVGPHRVTKDSKFYGRHSSGIYPLDVGELRTAFALGGTAAERIRSFRTDRLAKIMVGETPLPVIGHSHVVLHMIPLPAPADNQLFDVVSAIAKGTHFPLPLAGASGGNQSLVNLDGVVNFRMTAQTATGSYAQLFRNGAIEGVCAMNLEGDRPYILGSQFANMVIAAAKQYAAVQRSLEVAFPVFAMLSFVGAEFVCMKYTDITGLGWYLSPPLGKPVVALPEVVIDAAADDIPALMRPLMNMVWNAFGFMQSDMYNSNGGWKGVA